MHYRKKNLILSPPSAMCSWPGSRPSLILSYNTKDSHFSSVEDFPDKASAVKGHTAPAALGPTGHRCVPGTAPLRADEGHCRACQCQQVSARWANMFSWVPGESTRRGSCHAPPAVPGAWDRGQPISARAPVDDLAQAAVKEAAYGW